MLCDQTSECCRGMHGWDERIRDSMGIAWPHCSTRWRVKTWLKSSRRCTRKCAHTCRIPKAFYIGSFTGSYLQIHARMLACLHTSILACEIHTRVLFCRNLLADLHSESCALKFSIVWSDLLINDGVIWVRMVENGYRSWSLLIGLSCACTLIFSNEFCYEHRKPRLTLLSIG